MARVVYHVLTESSYFSDVHGGGGQRWVANMMMHDPNSKVVCKIADESWGFRSDRITQVPLLDYYDRIKPLHRHYPFFLRRGFLRRLLGRGLRDLKQGDVVWVHNQPDFAEALAPIIKGVGAKLVLHLHNSYLTAIPGKRVQGIALDKLVFVSHFLENEGKRCFPQLRNTVVIHNGADGNVYYPSQQPRETNGVPVIIFAGRLVPEKGPHVLVDAMRILHKKGVSALAVVYGATGFGSANPSTKYAQKLLENVPDNVQFRGYLSGKDLAVAFREADIFCCPSIWDDPFPLSNLEALASGLPVISTPKGGIPEELEHGGGLMTPAGDPVALAGALEELIVNRDRRQQMAADAYRAFQTHFTWNTVYRNYCSVLESL